MTAANVNGEEGLGSLSFTFTGPRRPKAPTNLRAEFNVSDKTIDCRWDVSALPGIRYALLCTPQKIPPKDDWHWSKIPDIEGNSYKLGGQKFPLVSGKRYTIKVRAISKFGLESATSNVKTVEAIDPKPEKMEPPVVSQPGEQQLFIASPYHAEKRSRPADIRN